MRHVAVGIITRDGQVLACQRRKSAAYPLKWEFPGGKIEEGETPEGALRRELREELGLEASQMAPLHQQQWTYTDGTGDIQGNGDFLVEYFLVPCPDTDPVNRVFEQILWVTPGQLLHMDILEGNREAIELLERRTHSS